MRLHIKSLEILNTSRRIDFEPGVNAITGGMSGGKTATVSCIRALLGAQVDVIPELEGRSIAGTVTIGDRTFRIVRRLVTTRTAKVDVAEIGAPNAWRLPAAQTEAGYDQTYREWLLEMLKLPNVRVPRAPTDDASPLTPVSINDYLMYCILKQNEIDDSVFGTPYNHDKNIKRRYVFEILYGLFSPDAAGLRERLRSVAAELNALTADANTLERLLADTPFASRAALQVERDAAERDLETIRFQSREVAAEGLGSDLRIAKLRERVTFLDGHLTGVQRDLEAERARGQSLERLHGQLIAQSRRLTRALVAERLLSDFEFHTCPRCGSSVPDRGDEETCRLCLQIPPMSPAPEELSAEQDRVIEQVVETEDLIKASSERARTLESQAAELGQARAAAGQRLDEVAAGFLSDNAERLRAAAAGEARLEEHVARLDDYLALHQRHQGQDERIAALERERDDLTDLIEAARHSDPHVSARLQRLDEALEANLRAFDAPRFDQHSGARIDRKTYLPTVDGRPFVKLQSQGVEVLVNVAHALAHQEVALADPHVPLPNLLVIDGISSNVGHEGVDLDRLQRMYSTVRDFAVAHPDLQVILTDNDPPPIDGIHIALRLSDQDRLVPADALGSGDEPSNPDRASADEPAV